jgi:phage gp46-like protein
LESDQINGGRMALKFTACATGPRDQRRTFWATQPDCAVEYDECGEPCGVAGLRLLTQAQCEYPERCDPGLSNGPCDPNIAKTIDNRGWLRGLALNILLTDSKIEGCSDGRRCRGGFWGESFQSRGLYYGSKLRQLPRSCNVNETRALIKAAVIADLGKLVSYGVATKVDADVRYAGSNRYAVTARIGLNQEQYEVGVTGTRGPQAWTWAA